MKKLISGWLVLSLAVLVGCAASTPPGVGVWPPVVGGGAGVFADLKARMRRSSHGAGFVNIPPESARRRLPPKPVKCIFRKIKPSTK